MVLTREKMQYALKSNLRMQVFVTRRLSVTHLSAMAPDTMVVAVVAKDIWKMKVVKVGPILTSDQSEASIGPRVDQSQLT